MYDYFSQSIHGISNVKAEHTKLTVVDWSIPDVEQNNWCES